MVEELRVQIAAEIKRVHNELDELKRLIKTNIGNTLVVEKAEQELKALHTRLSVLETNPTAEIAQHDPGKQPV